MFYNTTIKKKSYNSPIIPLLADFLYEGNFSETTLIARLKNSAESLFLIQLCKCPLCYR